jgi:transglutaminase-like putative cysteine protease
VSPRVRVLHTTRYTYERPAGLSPQLVRLRPAPHCRTPIEHYELRVAPASRYLHWLQDPYGNWMARLVFPEPAAELRVDVDLTARLDPINPFDFFVEPAAASFPFAYPDLLARELFIYLYLEPPTQRLAALVDEIRSGLLARPIGTIEFLVELNRMMREKVRYIRRPEPGLLSPEETLACGEGSCRDSAWLLLTVLRHLGLASRFTSGYLVQLATTPDKRDSVDLHAWCEAYVPGAGWIGLDATSGLLTAEGHIPLASAAFPESAAPVDGMAEAVETRFGFDMTVTRLDT